MEKVSVENKKILMGKKEKKESKALYTEQKVAMDAGLGVFISNQAEQGRGADHSWE